MKKNITSLADEHLQSLAGMQEAQTDDFFYSRLRARMENNTEQQRWNFPLKPVWVIGGLALLLAINGFMLVQQSGSKKQTMASGSSSLQSFAESYDQTITSSY